MDINHQVHLSDNQDKSGEHDIDNDIHKDINQSDYPMDENININKNYLEDLDPKIKDSFEEFIKTLNGHLTAISLPKEQKKALENQIEGIARKIKDIPITKKLQNDPSADSIELTNEDGNRPVAYDEDLEIDPQNADAYNNKGLSLYYSGNHLEAIECYDKALEINPEFACAHYNKGIILSVNGYNREAIECYDKALEINPQNTDAYNNKGLSLSTIKNYHEAIECYDKALEINPQNADAYYNKGLSLSSIGNNREAIECYDKALEINPPIRTCI